MLSLTLLATNHYGAGDANALFDVGDIVAVRIQQGRSPCYVYMAEVRSVEDEDVCLMYLRRSSDNVYRQPDEDNEKECSTEPIEMILGRMKPPTLLNERGQLRFCQMDMEAVAKKARQLHKVVYFK